jgi:hypothetical protein
MNLFAFQSFHERAPGIRFARHPGFDAVFLEESILVLKLFRIHGRSRRRHFLEFGEEGVWTDVGLLELGFVDDVARALAMLLDSRSIGAPDPVRQGSGC